MKTARELLRELGKCRLKEECLKLSEKDDFDNYNMYCLFPKQDVYCKRYKELKEK